MVRSFAALLAYSLLVTSAGAQELDATARLMRDLTEAPGPSAFEESVREIVVAEYRSLGAGIAFVGRCCSRTARRCPACSPRRPYSGAVSRPTCPSR